MPGEQFLHRGLQVVELAVDLAHGRQQRIEDSGVPRHHVGQRRETCVLALLQLLQLGEGQALEQFAVLLDLTAKEELRRRGEDGRALLRPQRDQLRCRGEAELAQGAGHLVDHLPLGGDDGLRITEARKVPACSASSCGSRLPANAPALRADRSSRRHCWRNSGP